MLRVGEDTWPLRKTPLARIKKKTLYLYARAIHWHLPSTPTLYNIYSTLKNGESRETFATHNCHLDTICSIEHENLNTQRRAFPDLIYYIFFIVYITYYRCIDYTCIAAVSGIYATFKQNPNTDARRHIFMLHSFIPPP